MNTLKAGRLSAMVAKARNRGQVEVPFTVDGLSLVVRSLTPDQTQEIAEELDAMGESAYAMHYQVAHVCHGLVEIEGVDLRDVRFIEVPQPDGSTVNVEKTQWVRDTLTSTWSKELVFTIFRKVMDAIHMAAEKASEGVRFRLDDETSEDKLRRLLGEIKAIEDLPDDLKEAVLKEHGLYVGTSKEELEKIKQRETQWLAQQASRVEDPVVGSDPRLETSATTPAPAPDFETDLEPEPMLEPEAPQTSSDNLQAVLNSRVPMNRVPVNVPSPAPPSPIVANPRPQGDTPQGFRFHAEPTPLGGRTQEIAALEALEGDAIAIAPSQASVPREVALQGIFNQPPSAGINPRYRNPFKPPGG